MLAGLVVPGAGRIGSAVFVQQHWASEVSRWPHEGGQRCSWKSTG